MADLNEQTSDNSALLNVVRESFAKGEFEATHAAYQELASKGKMPRNLRIEATCLAARALIARKDRSAARALLRPLLDATYTKVIHYDFLAHAFLDLRNYPEAARMCERAAELREAAKSS